MSGAMADLPARELAERSAGPLSGVQSVTELPAGYGASHPVPFVPAPNSSWADRHVNAVGWHGMDYIIRGIDAARKAAGCPGTRRAAPHSAGRRCSGWCSPWPSTPVPEQRPWSCIPFPRTSRTRRR